MRIMIDTDRSIGHQISKTDPLYLPSNKNVFGKLDAEELQAEAFGYSEEELAEKIVVKNLRSEDGPDNGPYTIKEFQ